MENKIKCCSNCIYGDVDIHSIPCDTCYDESNWEAYVEEETKEQLKKKLKKELERYEKALQQIVKLGGYPYDYADKIAKSALEGK